MRLGIGDEQLAREPSRIETSQELLFFSREVPVPTVVDFPLASVGWHFAQSSYRPFDFWA
jgi:hypothetical protein